MAEKPILFTGEMVRAILDGRKTQTRRIIKPQPPNDGSWKGCLSIDDLVLDENLRHDWCPYGRSGDLLWVRETWQRCPECGGANWKAYANDNGRACHQCAGFLSPKWKPSIHMFREDSRITLRVTDVRVERVQDISPDDCQSEGVQGIRSHDRAAPYARRAKGRVDFVGPFCLLWDSINAKRGYGWDVNPYVWAITFERVTL